jgi:hypothetical protein
MQKGAISPPRQFQYVWLNQDPYLQAKFYNASKNTAKTVTNGKRTASIKSTVK